MKLFLTDFRRISIRTTTIKSTPVDLRQSGRKSALGVPKLKRQSQKRLLRYSILAVNVVLLLAVIGFVVKHPSSTQAVQRTALDSSAAQTAGNPLDSLSSVDIAAHVARVTNLPEANAVANQADSVSAQLAITPADNNVIAKPQVVTTAVKSRRDIQTYVVKAGDTVSSIAAKFGVTSDSVRWSNGLNSDSVAAGTKLTIPPVNGIVYTVKAGDTVQSLSTKFGASKDQIIAFNDAEVSGLRVGEQIVVPDGTQAVGRASSAGGGVSYAAGFAWGSTAVYGANGYDFGWCTWYAANRRAQIGRPVPSNLGNAYSWYRIAAGAGLPVGLTPQVGAVAVNEGGNHVSVVEVVNPDGSFWVSEMNSRGQAAIDNPAPAGGWGQRDYKLYTSAGNLKFIY